MRRPFGSVVLDAAVRVLVPALMLYAVYVLAHGHYSPGGGFQAGAVLAVAMVLVPLVQGPRSKWGFGRRAAVILAGLGTLVFPGLGLLALLWGGNVLDYGALPFGLEGAAGRALATMLVETGVALAVMGVFVIFFELFETGEI
ncbi:MAG: MnhB domain-containing protein [Bacillota bacterium]